MFSESVYIFNVLFAIVVVSFFILVGVNIGAIVFSHSNLTITVQCNLYWCCTMHILVLPTCVSNFYFSKLMI